MINEITIVHISSIVAYLIVGFIIHVFFQLINRYALPIISRDNKRVSKLFRKIKIIVWLMYMLILTIYLMKINMYLTIMLVAVILITGWEFWKNLFAGIIIKYNEQFKVDEFISIGDVRGKIKSIFLSHSELLNEKGQVVIIPNKKLRSSIVRHISQKSGLKIHSFNVTEGRIIDRDSLYKYVLNCPYICTTRKIEVIRPSDGNYTVKASVLDERFIDEVRTHILLFGT